MNCWSYMADKRASEYGPHSRSKVGDRSVLNSMEARQAKPLGVMRYVLVISLALVIIGFVIAYVVQRI
jgi:hypothetical protein